MTILNNQEQSIIVPLGQALKDARLVASLSVDDVAEKLNLSVSTVRNIENELDETIESDKYPSIYLRGYLANYAKLVGLNDIRGFAEFQKLTEHHKYTLLPPTRMPARKNKSTIMRLILLGTLVLIALYFFADQQGLFDGHESIENKTENASMNIESSQSNANTQSNEAENKQIESDDESSNNVSAAEFVEPDDTNSTEQVADIANDSSDVSSNAAVASASVIDSVVEQTVGAMDPPLSSVNKERENDKNSNPETMSLSFSEDCWTEIFDANDKRLAFNLYKKGAQLTVTGIAPFKLKLGDPTAVEIQYQGKIVDGQFKSGRTTRFTIPQEVF